MSDRSMSRKQLNEASIQTGMLRIYKIIDDAMGDIETISTDHRLKGQILDLLNKASEIAHKNAQD